MGTRSKYRTGKELKKYLDKRKPLDTKVSEEAKAEYEARRENNARNKGYTSRVIGLDSAGNFLYRRVYWDKVNEVWLEPSPWREPVHPRRIKREKDMALRKLQKLGQEIENA